MYINTKIFITFIIKIKISKILNFLKIRKYLNGYCVVVDLSTCLINHYLESVPAKHTSYIHHS